MNTNNKKVLFTILVVVLLVLIYTKPFGHSLPKEISINKEYIDNIKKEIIGKELGTMKLLTFSLFSISPLVDDYLIEDDFIIKSKAISSNNYLSNGCLAKCSNGNICSKENINNCCHGPNFITGYICEDDKWKIDMSSTKIYTSNAYIIDNKLLLTNNVKALYKKNLKNRDVKIKVSVMGAGYNTIYFGGKAIFNYEPECGATKSFLIEIIKDVTDENKFYVVTNGEYKGEVNIEKEEARIEFSRSYGARWCGKKFQRGGAMYVHYIKSRPYFSCTIKSDEVVVRDKFSSGSTFGIDDLTYEPIKFCPLDYPAIVRSFKESGAKADIMGTITWNLAHGKVFTVPEGKVYEIMYIFTDFFKPSTSLGVST